MIESSTFIKLTFMSFLNYGLLSCIESIVSWLTQSFSGNWRNDGPLNYLLTLSLFLVSNDMDVSFSRLSWEGTFSNFLTSVLSLMNSIDYICLKTQCFTVYITKNNLISCLKLFQDLTLLLVSWISLLM